MKGDDAVTAAICAPQTPSRCHRNLDEELLKIGGYFLTDRFACLSNKSKEEYVMKRFLSLSLFLSLIAFILVWQKYYLLPIIVGVSSLSESSPSPDESYYYTVEKL